VSNIKSSNFGRRQFLKGIGAAAVRSALPGVTAAGGVFARPPSDKVVRIGVVGGRFGSRYQWHLDPNCKVTAVCDLLDDRLQRLVDVYGPATKYKDFRQFLKHPELDAVSIFTPAPLHVWMTTEAMKAGKHASAPCRRGCRWKNWSCCWKPSRRRE